MEKKSLRILAILFLIVLGLALFFILNDNNKANSKKNNVETADSLSFKAEYEDVNANNGAVQITIDNNSPVKYLSYSDFENKLAAKEAFVLYLGFPTCPWCRNIINVLFDVANSNNSMVYYINIRNLKNNNEEYEKLYELLNDYLIENDEGVKTLYVPDVYFFKNGNVVGHHLGSVDSQEDPTVLLDDNQKNELKNIYEDLFDKLK